MSMPSQSELPEERNVLTISMRSSVVVSLISRLFMWLIF